ncbi:MAG TPA: Dam family site-specific DNA-(adenine-N6)-methyltransferase [Puia sp.]|jgi:DNA adenine methylase|nr:Dam family site-specific DNA-(adenine-N6)-methyltransferase [Puia sp.]
MQDCITVKPFLRWAGGKSWLVNDVIDLLPVKFNNYHEPFLGSGSVFIKLKSNFHLNERVFLNDSNAQLINAFRQVKNHPEIICSHLKRYRNNERLFYQIRKRQSLDKILNASEFIFLNRTCFNGIFRVNLNGEFNVPYGFKKYKRLFDYKNIQAIHKLLKYNVSLSAGDFFETLKNIKENDLVFIDPPYTVNHENNGFIRYNEKIFSWEDQVRLKSFIVELIKRKAFFIMTNASHKSIFNLFGDIVTPFKKERSSLISSKMSARGPVNEYIFSNCLK